MESNDRPHSDSVAWTEEAPNSGAAWAKLVVLAIFVGFIAWVYVQYGESFKPENLAQHEARFRQFQSDYPAAVYAVAFLIYVLVTGLSLPGAAAMTLIIGWLFDFWKGMILVSFASTTGATLAFLLSRYLLRDTIQRKFGERLAGFNRALEKEGAFYLFSLRLIPAVPFFVINAVMGLTPIRTLTFWWISQLGMLPGTAVFTYAGSTLPDLQTLADKGAKGILSFELIVAFVILGLFPIVIKKVVYPWLSKRAGSEPEGESAEQA